MGSVTEISAELSEFVQKMGESVAEAKRQIDQASLEALEALAATEVTIPIVTKSFDGDQIVYQTDRVTVSPLSLGMVPTFYEFQKTDIEVAMDFEIAEDTTQNSRGIFSKIAKIGVNTKRIRQERKIKTDIKGYSSLKIEMVPVPPPNRIPELIVDDTLLPQPETPRISEDNNG
ncbi:hypothetical protein ACXWTF_00215 [Thiomicrolovo sp. ZZH C-3]